MREKGSSENHIINNLKVAFEYTKYLGSVKLYDIETRDQITTFLNTKIKDTALDPDKKWITTWNHYLNRIKLFLRWLHNFHKVKSLYSIGLAEEKSLEEWVTPLFLR